MIKEPERTHRLNGDGFIRFNCRLCELALQRRNVVRGRGSVPADVLLVGEAPGASEDLLGEAFVGPSGKVLRELLGAVGINAWHVDNVVCCRPPGNRTPAAAEVLACLPHLLETYARVRPKVVVFIGETAARFCRREWPDGVQLVHPAAILRTGAGRSPYMPAALRTLELIKRRIDAEAQNDLG